MKLRTIIIICHNVAGCIPQPISSRLANRIYHEFQTNITNHTHKCNNHNLEKESVKWSLTVVRVNCLFNQ